MQNKSKERDNKMLDLEGGYLLLRLLEQDWSKEDHLETLSLILFPLGFLKNDE